MIRFALLAALLLLAGCGQLGAQITIASQPTSYQPGNWTVWLTLIPVWTGAVVTICLPEVGNNTKENTNVA